MKMSDELLNALEVIRKECVKQGECTRCSLYNSDDAAEYMCGLDIDPCEWKISKTYKNVKWG